MTDAAMTNRAAPAQPEIREITIDDITASLREGAEDFRAMPMVGMAIGALYAIGGVLVLLLIWQAGLPALAFPLLTGFALVGPFAAMGLYEASRRRDAGREVSVSDLSSLLRASFKSSAPYLGFILLFVLFVWGEIAALLTMIFFGTTAASMADLVTRVFTTVDGFFFLILGNLAGAALAFVVFSVSVVSFPYMLEKDVDPVTAVTLSVSAVAKNFLPLAGWALFIGVVLFISWLPMFLGLLVTLPVLGHATWRLYKRMIAHPA